MPTILRIKGFRLYFYSNELNEPAHIHIDHGSASAKVWLHDFGIARNIGFSAKELGQVQLLVKKHYLQLQEAWNAYFGK